MAIGASILGLWTVISALVIRSPMVASWNFWIVGALAIVDGARLAREHRDWQGTLSIIAGSCLFVAGFIHRLHARPELLAASIIFGGLLCIAGVSSLGRRHAVESELPRLN